MNKSVLIIMSGALASAMLVAMIVSKNLSSGSKGNDAIKTTKILVAAKKIPTGTYLEEEDIKWVAFPEKAIFKNAVKKQKDKKFEDLDIYGKPTLRTIDKDEPISKRAVLEEGKKGGNYVAASLGPGMRAVSISIKAETSVAGFVRPGDFVDIIMTYQVKVKGNAMDMARSMVQKYASETILSGVKVLAVDQISDNENKKAKVGRTVTLEVDSVGAESLALARTMGKLSLALRRLGEEGEEQQAKGPLTTDARISKVLKKVNELEASSKVNSNNVRVYNGNQVENITVRSGQ